MLQYLLILYSTILTDTIYICVTIILFIYIMSLSEVTTYVTCLCACFENNDNNIMEKGLYGDGQCWKSKE